MGLREGIGNDVGSLAVGDETIVGKWFCQKIHKLGCGGDVMDLDGACLGSFADKVMLNFNVLGAGMQDGIVHKTDIGLIVIVERGGRV